MTDASPPAHQAQAVVQQLVACGIDRGGIMLESGVEDEVLVIRIRREARASAGQIACIHQATRTDLVLFDDPVLQDAYDRYAVSQTPSSMMIDAEAEVAKRGLLERFPRRSTFADMDAYVRALERHAGVAPGSMLRESGKGVALTAGKVASTPAGFDQVTTMIAVVLYATSLGDVDGMSFLGNAQTAGPAR